MVKQMFPTGNLRKVRHPATQPLPIGMDKTYIFKESAHYTLPRKLDGIDFVLAVKVDDPLLGQLGVNVQSLQRLSGLPSRLKDDRKWNIL